MKSISTKHLIAMIFSALLLAGCESMDTVDEAAVMDQQPVEEQQGSGSDMQADDSQGQAVSSQSEIDAQAMAEQKAKEAEMKEQAALREIRTVYFDFDQAELKPETRAPLMAHAAFLAMNPSVKVTLEGHADERGTKEYNIALGELRAKAVARFLIVNGVSASQIEAVSYGEEQPVDPGHNEAAWAKNRRVFISYQ